jgi:hypothetical protein
MVTDALKGYLQIANGLTDVTKDRASAAAKALAAQSPELLGLAASTAATAASQVQAFAEDLLVTSRDNRALLVGLIRTEVERAVTALGFAKESEVDAVRHKVDRLEEAVGGLEDDDATASLRAALTPAKKPATKKATAKKPAAKKVPAKKPAAKKAPARKVPAKKAPAAQPAAATPNTKDQAIDEPKAPSQPLAPSEPTAASGSTAPVSARVVVAPAAHPDAPAADSASSDIVDLTALRQQDAPT